MIKKILFFSTLLLAIGLRFSFIATIPPSASLDEVTIGWNAYSISHTGKDEYGYFLPILLRAYDDYRPALYVYVVVPFIKIFGLNVVSVRLPSIIMSVITVIMTYFLTKNLLSTYKKKEFIALLTMFLLAISPWHIYISRLGHEVNLGLTIVVGAILLFSYFLREKSAWFLVGSFFLFGLSFYTYQSEKVFTPLMLFGIVFVFWKQLLNSRKYFFIGLIVFIMVSLPIFFASFSPGAMLRLKGTSVFINNPAYDISAKQNLLEKNKGSILGQLLNNRRVTTIEIFTQNYLSHFTPKWLFSNTGDEPFKAPNTGLLYLWEAPFLLLGIYFFLSMKEFPKRIKIIIVLWILVDFVAPGLTTGAPHAMRAYTILPVPQILTGIGIISVVSSLKKYSKGISLGFIVLLSIIAMQSFFQFVSHYFITFPVNQSQSFQYAIRSTMLYVNKNREDYKKVIVSNTKNLYQSYMFYLFYTQYNPEVYLAHGGTKSGGFNETHVIDNIQFRPVNWEKEYSNSLLVGNRDDFPKSHITLASMYYLDGSVGVTIVRK